jgi:hypothetical protein
MLPRAVFTGKRRSVRRVNKRTFLLEPAVEERKLLRARVPAVGMVKKTISVDHEGVVVCLMEQSRRP